MANNCAAAGGAFTVLGFSLLRQSAKIRAELAEVKEAVAHLIARLDGGPVAHAAPPQPHHHQQHHPQQDDGEQTVDVGEAGPPPALHPQDPSAGAGIGGLDRHQQQPQQHGHAVGVPDAGDGGVDAAHAPIPGLESVDVGQDGDAPAVRPINVSTRGVIPSLPQSLQLGC